MGKHRRIVAALAVVAGLASTAFTSGGASAAPRWRPDPASYGISTVTDVPLTMPDGRVLRATVSTPADGAGRPARGRFPVVLSLTPYGKSVANPINPYLVQRGYLGVAVDVGGTGGSDGASELFGPTEAQDSKRIITWAAALPHSSGVVGMIGTSYLAIDQLFAAAAVGPGSPLKAIIPVAAAADPYRDLFVSGGVVNLESPTGLIAGYAGVRTLTPLAERGTVDLVDTSRLVLEHALQAVPFEGRTLLDTLLDGDRRYDGPYWQERAPQRVLQQIVDNGVAVFLVGGLYDVFQRGEPLLYAGLQNTAAGRPVTAPMVPGQAVSGRYQLLTGPWHHGNQAEGMLDQLQLRWFDQWLKGRDTGVADTTTPLQVIEPGGATYRAATYPLDTAATRRLYLGTGGQLTAAATRTASPPDSVVFTGLSNPCSRSTQQWSAGAVPSNLCGDRQTVPGPLPGEVAYTTTPFATAFRLAGPIGVTLQARANTPETIWVVSLQDVAPDGSAVDLTAGALTGSLRAVDPARSWPGGPGGWVLPHHPLTRASQQPVVPGALTRYDIEVRPAFLTIPAGHRLRVTIGTGDIPHLVPQLSAATKLLGGIYGIEHSPGALSWIDLSVAR